MTAQARGWTRTRIGEAFEFTRKPRSLRYDHYEFVPFVPMENVPIGYPYFDRYDNRPSDAIGSGTYFEPGDLLVAKITPSFENGKQGIIRKLPAPFGIATTEVIPIRGVPGVSDILYLAYFLLHRGVRTDLAGKMGGTTGRQRLDKSTLETYPIDLPPIEEQREITEALLAIQSAQLARRRELILERERKAALMHHLFAHGTRGEPTKQTEIGEMPESWTIAQLGNVARISYGLTVNQSRRECPEIAPYLTVANVTRGALRLDEVKAIGMLNGDADNYRLRSGDVLFVEGSGNPRLLGSAAVWNDELPFVLHQNHLIRARPDQEIVLPVWIMSYFNSDAGRSQVLGKATTSSGLHNINSRLIASLQLPLPDLAEQHDIVSVYDTCDSHIGALAREIGALDELLAVALEDLMSNRLPIAGLTRHSNPEPS